MKKIIHLMSTRAFSGAENVACQIINAFSSDENYEMTYVSVIDSNQKNLEDKHIKYYQLEKFNYSNVKKAIEELKPDIIHAHDIKASIMAALFYKKAKVISHIHSNHENMRKLNLKTFLFNKICKNFEQLIWVSDSALKNYYYYSKVKEKSVVLHNVIDSNEIENKIFEDSNNYQYDIIFLGRITYPKNPLRLIEIIKKLVTIKPNLKVAIVGNGELENDAKRKTEEYKLNGNIDYLGYMQNPYKILSCSKLMIMVSRYEGTPMCALEAIACGIPIVSTNTDGLVEIVKNGETGFLSDDDDEIVEKIMMLLNNEELMKNIKSNIEKHNLIINNINEYKKALEKIYS